MLIFFYRTLIEHFTIRIQNMNLWANHPLAKKHQVALLGRTSIPYSLNLRDSPPKGRAREKIQELNAAKPEMPPFQDSDLVCQRVGVKAINHTPEANIDYFPISWAEYTVTRDWNFRAGLLAEEQFHCLSVCGVVLTSDRQLIMSLRSEDVSIYRGHLHVSAAGFVDLDEAQSAPNVQFQFFKELEEELGLLPSSLRVYQLGLCEHLAENSASVEVCMFAETSHTAKEVLATAVGAVDNWEGKVSAYPIAQVVEMLHGDQKFNPGGVATLILALGL